jgi:hypothetical protein
LEIRVRWLGFEANEDTWEPVERLQEDVPVVLHRFLRTVFAHWHWHCCNSKSQREAHR